MKLGRIVIVNEILVTQMNHWGIFPIAAAVMGIAEKFTQAKKPDLLIWVLCGLFPVFFFIIREAAERFWLFFLLHLGGFAAAFDDIMDPEAFCLSFEHRCRMTKTKVIKVVEPLERL